jgi:serine/threonine protein phosphatase PrpC
MVAVADGVGGWADSGVDPALYSKQLCRNIKSIYEEDLARGDPNSMHSVVNKPRELLRFAVNDCREQGSST